MTDLLIDHALLVATVDADRRELAGGWVAITDGLITELGTSTDERPAAGRVLSAETDRRGGRESHKIRILTRDGRVKRLRMDAESGRFQKRKSRANSSGRR